MRSAHFLIVLVAALSAVLAAVPPAAAQSADVDTCINESSPRIEVAACTRVIEYWGDANAQIAWAFYHRAQGFAVAGNYDRAIDDYGTAIRLRPGYAHAFADRGLAHYGKGAYEQAIVDFDAAIRLEPADAAFREDRCFLLAILGRFERALRDCNQALRLTRAILLPWTAGAMPICAAAISRARSWTTEQL